MYKITGIIGELILKKVSLKKRKTFETATADQEECLNQLVQIASGTKFGRDHNFKAISTIEDYQQAVRLRKYSDFWKEYWQNSFPNLIDITWLGKIPYFAKTSGTTTGKSKYIPCSLEMVKANNNAGTQVLIEHFRNKPKSRILRGRYFMFAGSPNLEKLDTNVFAGELSGISARERPKWAGSERYYPPFDLAQIKDWKKKLEIISKDCINKNIRAISGLPSWLQILFLTIFKDNPKKNPTLKTYFPKMELLVHGGMSFEPYQIFFNKISKNEQIDFREIYAASEGFFAVSDRTYGEGLRLVTDNGIFYEFVKLEDFNHPHPKRYWLKEIENDIDYVLIVSTCAGLWSYIVGDIIRFIDYKNLRLLFSGRISQTLSMFGEKVLTEEVESAIAKSLKELNKTLKDYAIYSSFVETDSSKGLHTYIIELNEIATNLEVKLEQRIDKNLRESNSGYATRRKDEVNILMPKVILARKGLFEDWMKFKGKSGGQNKVPRVLNQVQMEELITMNK